MVAAWMSALTGVGPAIASGSHTYRGICALFPAQPSISARPTRVAALTYLGVCITCGNHDGSPCPMGQTCTRVRSCPACASIPCQDNVPT